MGAYKHLTTINLAQGKELSLKRQGSLAQAKSFRLSEIENKEYFKFSLKLAHLAQARGLSSSEHSKPKGASYCHSRLGESFLFGRETTCLGEHNRCHLLSRMQSQKIHPEIVHILFSHHQKHIKSSRAPHSTKTGTLFIKA